MTTKDRNVGCAINVVHVIIASPLAAFVFMKLWQWFVAARFGISELPFWGAWGLVMTVAFAIPRTLPIEEKDDPIKSACDALAWSLVKSVLSLGIGWIVHLLDAGYF